MLKSDLQEADIELELLKHEQINYIASLYRVPVWRVRQKIKLGISLREMEVMFDYESEL